MSLFEEGEYHAYFQKLEHVIPHIEISESGVKQFEVHIMDVFRYQAWYFGGRVPYDVKKGDYVGATGKVLENLDFPLDLSLLDGF